MQRPVTRIEPIGPPEAYKTYSIVAPEETHFRPASCEEVECEMRAAGWVTLVDETSDLGEQQAAYIRGYYNDFGEYQAAGRVFTESRGPAGTLFEFPPGEECFRAHQIRLDREEFFIVRGGDWRGNPRRELRQHDTPENWVEDFAEHQDRIDKQVNG
jgi:hypothetical protein